MTVCISVKNGPDKGKRILTEQPRITIGRDRSSDIPVNDLTVSRQHCAVFVDEQGIHVEDLNSKNRTCVNGSPIGEPVLLQPSDEVKIGETVFSVHIHIEQKEEDGQKRGGSTHFSNNVRTMVVNVENISIEKIASNLDLMYKVNSAIHSHRTISDLMKTLLELIFEVIPAERGTLLLYNKKSKRLEPEISLSSGEGICEDICVSQTIANQVYSKKVAIITKDAMSDPRFPNKMTIIQNNIRSAMCVPLGTINKMLGVIHLDSRMQSGIFSEKDLNLLSAIANQAAIAIENIQFYQRLQDENEMLQEALQHEYNMVGNSVQIHRIFEMINKLSLTDSTTVLIRGESGTGKELVARAIHYNSARRDKPFICVNCGALNKNLLESELFGHEKGAFTGAIAPKKGRFEIANGGTIFLDEIGELSPESQVKLLRVLELGTFERVGGIESFSTDVRVLAATNRNLEQAISDNAFREDLYYRLNVIQIDIPPLRERREDIMPLALFFLEKYTTKTAHEILQFSPEAEHMLKNYHWPGNVRELKNCIERAVVLGNSNIVLPEDLPFKLTTNETQGNKDIKTLIDVEREHILNTLNHTGWNKKLTAELLGIQRSTLYEKLKMYHISL
ncbi:MAG: sigma 54-interacting transcriptional regulator [Candidatus Auribacterota bacterium]